LMMQVLSGDIKVVMPPAYAETTPVFPWKG
jgi:hypothetical protein